MKASVLKLTKAWSIFTDDVKIVKWYASKDIKLIKGWLTRWDRPLSPDKCQFLTADVNPVSNKPLHWSSEVKNLGVLGTCDFQPSGQCQVAANKVRAALTRPPVITC